VLGNADYRAITTVLPILRPSDVSLSPYAIPEGVAHATRLLELSERLADSGRRGEALEAAREASEILRGLARVNPDHYLNDFAEGLSVLAVRLRKARRIRGGGGSGFGRDTESPTSRGH